MRAAAIPCYASRRSTGAGPVIRCAEGKQESTPAEEPASGKLPFIQAAQVYVPGANPPNATVAYQLKSRRGGGLRTLMIPNWEGGNQTQNLLERLRESQLLVVFTRSA